MYGVPWMPSNSVDYGFIWKPYNTHLALHNCATSVAIVIVRRYDGPTKLPTETQSKSRWYGSV